MTYDLDYEKRFDPYEATETKFGRVAVADPPSALLTAHHAAPDAHLQKVRWAPAAVVLDQEDLTAQGIDVSSFIPGAPRGVDALGSCTANATFAKLSSILPAAHFIAFLKLLFSTGGVDVAVPYTDAAVFSDGVLLEKGAIAFYYLCTHQTGQPSQEWPPTDCGSSGLYIVDLLVRLGTIKGASVAHGATNIVSAMQRGSLLMGSPFLYAWMRPDSTGLIDRDGSVEQFREQLAQGIAGGHETNPYEIVELGFYPDGRVDPFKTLLRVRNSWTKLYGAAGDFVVHLSTIVLMGGQVDLRLLRT